MARDDRAGGASSAPCGIEGLARGSRPEVLDPRHRMDRLIADTGSGRGFDAALAGRDVQLIDSDGQLLITSVRRWHECADDTDEWLLSRCDANTLDVGCGPGRLVAELHSRGVPALGVDVSAVAVRSCRRRGGRAVRADVWAVVPDEGRWRHVVLADGNIGIGGDPAALLRRCLGLLRTGGTLLVEATPAEQLPQAARGGLWRGVARWCEAATGRRVGPLLPWAVVGLDALVELARTGGWQLLDEQRGARCFAHLRRPQAVA